MSLGALEELLRRAMGLDLQSIGRGSLVRAVDVRAAALRVDNIDAYSSLVAESEEELQELIEQMVVPETWFFRHAEAYTELADLAAPWLSENRGTLRVLSLPCSSGEEPYSIAMALLDRGLPRDRFVIDAVDISQCNLRAAEHGVFGRNSMRAESGRATVHLESVRTGLRVAEHVRRQVRFSRGNVLAPAFCPASAPYDVIFCRNLLIYFDLDAQQRALRAVERWLAPDGRLFVGPGDGFAALTFGFESSGRSGAFAFRKATVASPRHATGATSPRSPGVRKRDACQSSGARTRHAPAPAPSLAGSRRRQAHVAPREEPPSSTTAVTLAEVQVLADAGRVVEAAALCRRHLSMAGPSAQAFYLLALVTDALNDRASAIECYRKALYLDPAHPEALAQLSLLTAGRGDGERADLLAARARRAARDGRRGSLS